MIANINHFILVELLKDLIQLLKIFFLIALSVLWEGIRMIFWNFRETNDPHYCIFLLAISKRHEHRRTENTKKTKEHICRGGHENIQTRKILNKL